MTETVPSEAETLSSIPGYLLKGEGAYISLMNMTTSLIHVLFLVTFKYTNKCFHACLDHCSIACSCYCDKYSQQCLQGNHPPLTILSFHSLPIPKRQMSEPFTLASSLVGVGWCDRTSFFCSWWHGVGGGPT
jgi:hypothetical protein